MVKGVSQSKGSGSGKRSSAAQSSKSSSHTQQSTSLPKPQPGTSSRKAKAATSLAMCCGCNKLITDDTKALQCDRCQSDIWKCIDCLSISPELYDQLMAESSCGLRCFCNECDSAVLDTSSKDNLSSERIDKLVTVVERLMDRLVEVEDILGDRGVMGTLGSGGTYKEH